MNRNKWLERCALLLALQIEGRAHKKKGGQAQEIEKAKNWMFSWTPQEGSNPPGPLTLVQRDHVEIQTRIV